MKSYKVIKINKGFQVVWFWANSYTKTGFQSSENFVKNGFFKTEEEAENFANELEFFGE
tara:strand:+ start:1455 stop:1631 length:177 start_codon:yes stop_codon:yes gene_type:complete